MKSSSVRKLIASVIVLTIVITLGIFGHGRAVSMASESTAGDSVQTIQLEYYQYNVCGACHPEDDFFEIVSETIKPLKSEYPYEISVYNTFRVEERKHFQKRLQELELEEDSTILPALFFLSDDGVATVCLSSLDEIKEKIVTTLKQTSEENLENVLQNEKAKLLEGSQEESTANSSVDWKGQLRDAVSQDTSTDAVLLYFSTVSCTDCSEVKALLKEMKSKEQTAQAGTLTVHEFNIAEGDGVVLVQKLFSLYNVPSDKQQVPIVFYKDGYLSGADEITKNLEQVWKSGGLTNFDLDALLSSDEAKEEKSESTQTYIGLAITGFINGVNPCGASMLLMLLAAIAMSGRSVIKTGCAYLAGKFTAYFAMGMGLYKLFMAIGQDIFLSISNVLTWIFAAVFFILAILYLIDFVNVKRKQYGKIRMQLPTALRKWNHERIEKASKINAKWMIPAAVVLGIMISAGEFFCTGQVYLAAILYMMKMQQEMKLQTNAAFIVYVTAMCIPSFLIVLVIEKTKNVISMSNKTFEWLPAIKLVTAIIFFMFAVFMLIQ